MKDQTTLAAVAELTPGNKDNPTWVNGEFTALVKSAVIKETKTGTSYASGQLCDPDSGAHLSFSWFGRKAFPEAGSTVLVGGNGICLEAFNGKPQLKFGKGTTVNTVAAAPGGGAQKSAPSAAPPTGGHAPKSGPFLGQTVGMAINNAALDARAVGFETLNMADHDAVAKFVWQRASVYLRVAQSLEAGKLSVAGAPKEEAAPDPADKPADKFLERPAGYTPPATRSAAAKPSPGPGGSVAHDPDEDDDRIPF